MDLEKLVLLRQNLHKYPEISGGEVETAKRIRTFISQYQPDVIEENIGGSGILFVFSGQRDGPTVTVRSELDALPIKEVNVFAHKSTVDGVSHKCGHDGHMAIVASLASYLSTNRPKKGRVILLFQPAEETGEGAQQMLNDPKFKKYYPDYIFALHNLPGVSEGMIVTKSGTFAAASKGIIIELLGQTSHAAEPENGISPALAMTEIVQQWSSLNNKSLKLTDLAFITVVHAELGSASFGISPGKAKVMATFRAFKDEDLRKLESKALDNALSIAKGNRLQVNVSETEVFASTINEEECVEIIENAVLENKYAISLSGTPNRWSEDFGVFTQQFKGAMFGLGAGIDYPDLHNADYDFPDKIIPIGSNMFVSIINQILNK